MISIIVPVYNVENYLSTCINSILLQDYKDFELLLIDDGSTDNSGRICDYYGEKDNRIKVFHKTNAGVSSARNYGLLKAVGEFVCFIDSDDWVATNYLSNFFVGVESYDLVIQNMYDYNKCAVFHIDVPKMDFYDDLGEPIEKFRILLYGGPCIKLFKRCIIEDNHIEFPQNIQYGEDTLFFYKYLLNVKSLCFVNQCAYYYRNTGVTSLSKRIHEPIKLLYFYFREKKYVVTLCEKYSLINSSFYKYFDSLQVKRALLNYLNCYTLEYSYKSRKKIWYKTILLFKMYFKKSPKGRIYIFKRILIKMPFFICDFVFKMYSNGFKVLKK